MRPFVIAVAAILLAGPAALAQSRLPAPPPCPEGRLADGRCVDPVLARLARNQTICFSQIKLSYIACPGTLPGRDARYKYPYTVVTERQREIDMLYERQAYQSVFGTTVRVRTTIVAPPVTTLPATTTRATTAR